MRFQHPDFPGRRVRLAYCTNLHAAEDLPGIRRGIEEVTLPLRRALGITGSFGLGLYLPALAAMRLASYDGEEELAEWGRYFAGEGLDPFTFNAFPYGNFQRDGLKADVYRPTWLQPERGLYTQSVAQVAQRWQRELPFAGEFGHISVSTHPGAHVSQVDGTQGVHGCSRGLAAAILALALGDEEGAPRVVLSIEAEPWAIAGDSLALAEYRVVVGSRAQALLVEQGRLSAQEAADVVRRHLGTCLDACHSAVEFETVERALDLAIHHAPLGKLQYSSALSLVEPQNNRVGRDALLLMDEPRFLHQTNGRTLGRLLRSPDLDALASDLMDAECSEAWLACDEWRCHFHVPVHMKNFGGLQTTQAYAESLLRALLVDPGTWGIDELHVEIETYTWSLLQGREALPLVEGMRREYEHVLALLASLGWNYVG